MKHRLDQMLGKRLGDMELSEFNLVILLTIIIVESIITFPISLFVGNIRELATPTLIIMVGCGFLLLFDLYSGKHNLAALFALIILDGIAIPMFLRPGHVAYGVAIMWFAAGMLIVYCVFEGLFFYSVLVLLIFEYAYLYSNVFFPSNGTKFYADQVFHFSDLTICFVGTVIMIVMLLYFQEKFYIYQQWKIDRSSHKIGRAGAAKRHFLSNMSYEIRTPMNSIINLSEIMLKEEMGVETKSEANTIRSAAYDLLSIIDDVLTYAKIDAGDMHLIEDTYSFEKLVREIIRTISEEVHKKKLFLDLKIDGDIPNLLLGDSIIIQQIFLYLLFISIDFTSSGRIVIDINCERDNDAGQAYFCCTVADTGKGLSQIDIQSLFGMYDIYDSRQSSNLKGIGLKFTICKELLSMMQGDIKVESIEGVGLSTTFTFRQKIVDSSSLIQLEDDERPNVLIYIDNDINMAKWHNIMETLDLQPTYCRNYYGFDRAIQDKHFDFIFVTDGVYENLSNIISLYECQENTYVLADFDVVYGDFGKCRPLRRPLSSIPIVRVLNHKWSKEEYKKRAAEETFTANNAKVLVVDDNAVNLKVAAGIFNKYGIDIAVATCGEDGIRKIENEQYDLILMDMVMPDMGGGDVLKIIRSKEGKYYKEVPFIALTAQNGANVREEMLELGFQEYLAKPVRRRYLEKCLLEFLPEELIERVKIKEEDDNKRYDKTAADKGQLPAGGLNTEKGLLNIGFNQDAYAAILNTYYAEGIKYLELLPNLLETGDIQLFTTDVHGIKSSSASIGAMEVSALFKELESDGKAGNVESINKKFSGYLDKFKEVLEEVKGYLTGIGKFSETGTEENLDDKEIEEMTAEILQNLKTELDKMNLKITDELVPELASKNFGAQVNGQIKKLREAYDMFDFHQVKAILNELIENINK